MAAHGVANRRASDGAPHLDVVLIVIDSANDAPPIAAEDGMAHPFQVVQQGEGRPSVQRSTHSSSSGHVDNCNRR